MTNPLTILSYHKFVDTESEYRFSRTYEQFWHDIRKKQYHLITIDDGMKCQIKACAMLQELGIRAKLFICTSLVGTEGYCTWKELKELSNHHDIENHSHTHRDHTLMPFDWVSENIIKAQSLIAGYTGVLPKFFVPPYNQYNHNVKRVCDGLGLTILSGRENVLNISK